MSENVLNKFYSNAVGILRVPAEYFWGLGGKASMPAAGAAYRDTLSVLRGGVGVADLLKWGRKNAADADEFVTLADAADLTAHAALTTAHGSVGTVVGATTLAVHTDLTAAHGASGAVVGTTNVQTLSGKTHTGGIHNTPTLNTPSISGTGWANANHAHAGSTSGGQIPYANLTGRPNDRAYFHLHTATGGDSTWINMPVALTALFGTGAFFQNLLLTPFTEFRLHAALTTVGSASAKLRLEYFLTSAYVDAAATAAAGDVVIGGAGFGKVGAWTALAASAITAERSFRIVGLTGDGIVDPVFAAIVADFR